MMCAQSWDQDTSTYPTIQSVLGHMVVYHAELTLDRVRKYDHLLTAGEVDARTRLGRLRLEHTLDRLLRDFATRWCAQSRGKGNR